MNDNDDYILGTGSSELERLGFQHHVWSKEAYALWDRAGLGRGQRILDLGCGPGFATFDLAGIAGPEGEVIGVDVSPAYIAYAESQAKSRGLRNTRFIVSSFNDLALSGRFDAIYSRWIFAWIDNVPEIVGKAAALLKPGGVLLTQEYLNWGTFRIIPERPQVQCVIEACRESWKRMGSEINIAASLPAMFRANGLAVEHEAPLAQLSRPGRMMWQWPGTFLQVYSLKLIELGLLRPADRAAFLKAWPEVEADPDSLMVAPLMMEAVARRPA